MSLKMAVGFFAFIILAIYLTYLNPQEVEFHLTNSISFKIPLTVFLLASVLIGVSLTGFFTGLRQTSNSLKQYQESRARKKQENLNKKWQNLYQKAKNAFVSGHPQKAIGLFEKILAGHPDHAESLYHLGQHMRMEGKYDDAIELHRKAAQLDSGNIATLFELSKDYSAAEMHDKEIQTLEKILSLDRNSLPTLKKLRNTYLKLDNWEKAYSYQKSILPLIHESDELAEEQERFSQIVYSKGIKLYKKGQADSAIVEFKRSIRENGRSLPAYITLGDIYFERNKLKPAIKIWKEGFTATHSPICLLRLQRLFESTGQLKEVVKIYNWAANLSQNSKSERLGLMLGAFLLQQGNQDETINMLEGLPEPSLPIKLLILKAYQEKQDAGQVEITAREACDLMMKSFYQYTCGKCGAIAEEWTKNCPKCKTWDSLALGGL